MKNTKKVALASQIILLSFFALMFMISAKSVHAENLCNFPRDLDLGSEGEDVRCLQKYLNSSGIKIAETGLGSVGKETNQYRELTKQAVIKWQKMNNLSPASGFFGQMSRKLYYQKYLTANPNLLSQSQTASNQASNKTIVNNEDDDTPTKSTVKVNTSGAISESSAKDLILKAIKQIEDAGDQIDDSSESASNINKARDDLNDAWAEFGKSIKSYFNKDYTKVKTFAGNALSSASDAYEKAGGETKEDEVNKLIDKVDNKINDINDLIDAANDKDEDVSTAEDLISEAEDLLRQAEDAVDEEDYSNAEELANSAEDKANDAKRAIGKGDTEMTNANKAINDAKNAIAEARQDIIDAQDDDADTSDAEELLNDAKDLLNQARDKYDDEDYVKAKSLARSAQRKAQEASDAL